MIPAKAIGGSMLSAATVRLVGAVLLAAVPAGCAAAQHPAAPARSTSTAPARPPATVTRIAPLPVRTVENSQPTSPEKCPAIDPAAPTPPGNPLVTCDVARTTRYTLGPETLRLELIHVAAPTPLTADFYEVNLTLDPASATAWAAFTTAHLHGHFAFLRDDLVLEAPLIEDPVTSGRIALTTQTLQAAEQLARLAGRPA